MNIISRDEYTGQIWFPAGKSNTCDFATKTCLDCCPQEDNIKLRYTYKYFLERKPEIISKRIQKELLEQGCVVLYWFESGDCPRKMTNHIYKIQSILANEGIVQLGFTRNQDLWRLANTLKNMRMVLTVENKVLAKKLSEDGLVGVPNYKTQYVSIYRDVFEIIACSQSWTLPTCGAWLSEANEIYESWCCECLRNKRGCFVNFRKVS